MTQQQFDNGYKLLRRFMKDIGRYQDFLKITVQYDRNFPKKLKNEFNKPMAFYAKNISWRNFFDFAQFVGPKWTEYNDPGLCNLRDKWEIFLLDNNFNGLDYINQ